MEISTSDTDTTKQARTGFPSFREALRFWLKLGLISFGGPAGQISIMHRELVETKRWISEEHFLNALNFTMLLPGPEAQQLATYLGWRIHGAKGGIAAGALFVIPSMFVLFALSWIYIVGGDIPWLAAIFYGLLAAVIAVVAQATLRIGSKALKSVTLWGIAELSFVAIYFFGISFVLIILAVGFAGYFGHRFFPRQFPAGKGPHSSENEDLPESIELPTCPAPGWKRTAAVVAVCSILWWGPILALAGWLGWESTPAQQGLFFSKAALVTVGGAYAVLPYVAQQAVESQQWLTHSQMMTGLALAETTPGPLIMVLQFVGFVGGWQNPGNFTPLGGATIGALITTWATFLPCFLFIFLGGPYIEKIGNFPTLSAALTAITAAVVGVILNLGVKFGLHAIWPDQLNIDWFIIGLTVLAFFALQRFKAGLIPVIIGCGIAGLLYRAIFSGL
ncbi:MAG: chromate efflux transporter [Verrucomicrobiales bacterium]|nr:chromate efflux transporter [Verrucomicrobiales bacterium]